MTDREVKLIKNKILICLTEYRTSELFMIMDIVTKGIDAAKYELDEADSKVNKYFKTTTNGNIETDFY